VNVGRPVRRTAWFLLAALALASCVPRAPEPVAPPADAPEEFPAAEYARAAEAGEAVYRVDGKRSLVIARVHRDGALARLGHDHVVSSRNLGGFVLLAADGAADRADLYLPLASLEVDDPALRAAEGLGEPLDEDDVAGTRSNMFRVLDADAHPFAVVHATRDGQAMKATLELNGEARELDARIDVETRGDMLRASGAFTIDHADFGLVPFSLLGGALAVREDIDIRFDIVAERAQ